jgi:hypothetical protein
MVLSSQSTQSLSSLYNSCGALTDSHGYQRRFKIMAILSLSSRMILSQEETGSTWSSFIASEDLLRATVLIKEPRKRFHPRLLHQKLVSLLPNTSFMNIFEIDSNQWRIIIYIPTPWNELHDVLQSHPGIQPWQWKRHHSFSKIRPFNL